MAKAVSKKPAPAKRKPAARKPAARKSAQPRKPRGGILGDILGLRAGLRPSFEAMLARDPGEERLLAYVAIAFIIAFLAGLPEAVSIADGMDSENALLGLVAGRFVVIVIFGTLALYGVAALVHLFCLYGFGGRGTYKAVRMAVFWGLFLGIPLSILKLAVVQFLPELGMSTFVQPLVIAIFVFRLWLWSSFIAIAEKFPRGAVFMLVLAVYACLTGLTWMLNAFT